MASIRKTRGFSLLEVLIALLIFSFGLMGLAALQSFSVKNNQSSSFRSQATALAYMIIDNMRAVFGRSYAAEPDKLVKELRTDEAIAEADTLLLTVPNQLGVEYNAHVIEAILTHVAPALGWR